MTLDDRALLVHLLREERTEIEQAWATTAKMTSCTLQTRIYFEARAEEFNVFRQKILLSFPEITSIMPSALQLSESGHETVQVSITKPYETQYKI